MSAKIFDALKILGLSESEIRVYMHLLGHGAMSPPELSRGVGIARSNLHYILLGLFGKDLVRKQRRGKRFVYIPADPSATLKVLDQKRETLKSALGELEALYKKQKNKPVIKFYEGTKELEQIFDDALTAKGKEILGFASTNRLFEVMKNYNWTKWQKELKGRGIFLRDILSAASKEAAEAAYKGAAPYQDYKLLDERYGDVPTDILVWDDKVAIMALDMPVFGTVIENQNLADTYRIQFDLMWKTLSRSKTTS